MKLSKSNTFILPVEISTPVGETVETETVRLEVRRLDADDYAEIELEHKALHERHIALCKRVVVRWLDGVTDDAGVTLPATPEHLHSFICLPNVFAAVAPAYLTANAGVRSKNSVTPPGSGAA